MAEVRTSEKPDGGEEIRLQRKVGSAGKGTIHPLDENAARGFSPKRGGRKKER